ncbi:hypothetical protein [Pontibacter arcticus]|uniref:Uncharacterized protein n=1 Tax=Pontibacter arcticus TaxID=2080288 RepID=A0A364RER6_9BACT|nr:hypothetical protein [Pontibacter arcticus]RAU82838.1 hypothetical protein DP923_06185 [Pontibacter arcticus]
MPELTIFLNNLLSSDLIILTRNTERTYCRFFKDGVYLDRMYVSDPALLAELHVLLGEGDEINAPGIAKLKQLYLATDTQPPLEALP